jgi:hypothetical protein
MADKQDVETTAIFETSLDNIRVRLEITGYDNVRDRQLFECLAQLIASIAAGLKVFDIAYALRIGPIILAAVATINSVYNSFKKMPTTGGYKQ